MSEVPLYSTAGGAAGCLFCHDRRLSNWATVECQEEEPSIQRLNFYTPVRQVDNCLLEMVLAMALRERRFFMIGVPLYGRRFL
jgi:hypothetical protein